MKLKSLLLGSAAALALSSSAFAADAAATAPVMSLDICDALSLQGVTISGSSNSDGVETCLVISGQVEFEFFITNNDNGATAVDDDLSWNAQIDEIDLNFNFVSETDYGPAIAFIGLTADGLDDTLAGQVKSGGTRSEVTVNKAYVQVGGFVTGRVSSIWNKGDDKPHVYTNLYNSNGEDHGVGNFGAGAAANFVARFPGTAESIQYVHDLGDGVSVAVALENIVNGLNHTTLVNTRTGGDFVGVLAVSQDWGTAHLSVAALDALSNPEGVNTAGADFVVHAGATLKLDSAEIIVAAAFSDDDDWNILASVQIPLDDVTLAFSAEAYNEEHALAGAADDTNSYGVGASIVFTGVEGVEFKLGANYTSDDDADSTAGTSDAWKAGAYAKFTISDDMFASVELTHEYNQNIKLATDLNFAPGGGYTANLGFDFISPKVGNGYFESKLETKKTF